MSDISRSLPSVEIIILKDEIDLSSIKTEEVKDECLHREKTDKIFTSHDGLKQEPSDLISDSFEEYEQDPLYINNDRAKKVKQKVQSRKDIMEKRAEQKRGDTDYCIDEHKVQYLDDTKNVSSTSVCGDNNSKDSASGTDEVCVSLPVEKTKRSRDCLPYDHLVPKLNTKSPVWEHFGLPADENNQILDVNISICKLCSNSVSSKGGSTSNMYGHLKIHHPLAFKEISQNASTSRANIKSQDYSHTDLNFSRTGETSAEEPGRKKQKTFHDYQPLDSQSSKNCTEALSELLSTTMQSYRLVEHPSFKKFVRTLNTQYTVPSRKYFSRTGVPKLYIDTVEKMKRELSFVSENEVSITTDCWTSICGTQYISLTAHFITSDWFLRSFCLHCAHFEEDHTADNICEMLTDKLSDWNIDIENIASCTTNNGSNIIKAANQLKIPHITCFAHNINIGINHTLEFPQIKKALARLKNLQNTIAQSSKMKQDLQKAQELLQMDVVTLPSASPTRWWSTYKLCKRFLENQLPISKILLAQPNKKHLMLDGSEATAIQDFVSATSGLEHITKQVCGEDYTTGSSVQPILSKISKILKVKKGDSTLAQSLKCEILKSLSNKYEAEPLSSLLHMSSLCDPRFRKYYQNNEHIKKLTTEKMAEIYKCRETCNPGGGLNYTQNTARKEKKGLELILDDSDDDDNSELSIEDMPTKKVEAELRSYLAMPKVGLSEDPVVWWKSNHNSFPTLGALAKKYLAIQGTSAPSERVFSAGDDVITKQRASLFQKNAEMQIFLAQNQSFI